MTMACMFNLWPNLFPKELYCTFTYIWSKTFTVSSSSYPFQNLHLLHVSTLMNRIVSLCTQYEQETTKKDPYLHVVLIICVLTQTTQSSRIRYNFLPKNILDAIAIVDINLFMNIVNNINGFCCLLLFTV